MANQFFFEEQQITDIVTALIFISGGCMTDEENGDIPKRCVDLAIKLKKQYGRQIKVKDVLVFDEPEENPYSEKILEEFPELKGK